MIPAPDGRGRVDPHRTRDHLGRVWPHAKLDRLLADPNVTALVDEMAAAWLDADGAPQVRRGRTWAYGRGRSEAEFALLVMLWFRRLVLRMEVSS